jgi:N-acetylglucosaminyl-diphospho-decaprenol L-rhamnosyltransferase
MAGRVDVIVPTRDTRDLTLGCVSAVLAGTARDHDLGCVVVDNGSTDGTREALSEAFPDVRVIANRADVGYGGACNQGAAGSTAEYVLFLNSDVMARQGAIDRLVGFLDSSVDHVAAGGNLVDHRTGDTQVGFAVRGFPTLANQVALLVGLERFWPRNPVSRRQLMLDFEYGRTQDAEQPAGAALLCRRADFEAVGGFDEGFHYLFEDVDLVQRLRGRGRIGYVHDAVFEHVRGATFSAWDRASIIVTRYRSLLRYFEKNRPRWELRILRVVVGSLAAVRALGWLPFDRRRAAAYRSVARLSVGRGR